MVVDTIIYLSCSATKIACLISTLAAPPRKVVASLLKNKHFSDRRGVSSPPFLPFPPRGEGI